ncbi:putative RING-H2 finger protein ATL21A [Cucumis melo var. makuwa]|uniref:RING-H2 finger protein ATL21A n=2 Tax=Cucumis melo TaxID=3656 RepID=A0A5A7TNI3_CUCMM|nr:putative RING-H2 finger protein ATL21A [Cucumis melo var. makuwa]TYK16568.1 putative RING-H2 finger protein ATL21A [Cucumis melo var. makuwa]
MALSKFSVALLLLFFFNGAESQFLCKSSSCSGGFLPEVRFPFRLKNWQDSRCGYQPDFDLFCNNRNQTILNLPNAGDVMVEIIDYKFQRLWINDPDQCFPKRILMDSFNLDNSPFIYNYRLDQFTVLNCSYYVETLPFDRVRRIKCMSGANHTVINVPDRDLKAVTNLLPTPCKVVATKKLPLTGMELEEGMVVRWSEPECGNCELRGGDCGFRSNSSGEVVCFNLPKSGIPRGAKYGLIIGVGIPGVLFLIGLVCYICGKCKAFARPNRPSSNLSLSLGHDPTSTKAGLDGPTIESFPKTTLGQSRRLPKSNDTTCAICLSEYQSKETIRTIPDCGHFFHVNCVDEWLKLNATCPVCRTSPEDSSATSTPSQSTSSMSVSLPTSPRSLASLPRSD